MKATGIVGRVDDLGRIVIPKEIRRTLRIREGDPLLTMPVAFMVPLSLSLLHWYCLQEKGNYAGKEKVRCKTENEETTEWFVSKFDAGFTFFSQPCLSNYMENGELPQATLTLLFENLTIITI